MLRIHEMLRRVLCLVAALGCLQHSGTTETVRGRQASVILLSGHQTDEGATASATKSLSTVAYF